MNKVFEDSKQMKSESGLTALPNIGTAVAGQLNQAGSIFSTSIFI